jgi:hypothetical protein
MTYELRTFSGNASDTTLASPLTAGGLTINLAPGTGVNYPAGPAFIIVDYDSASNTEKIRYTSRSGDTLTVPASNGRGVDGTVALAHASGAKVRHCWTATDAQEANRAAFYTVGQVTAAGSLLIGSGANALAELPVSTNGRVLSLVGGVPVWADLPADPTKTVRVPHTFTIYGTVAVPVGDTNYVIPFFVPKPAGQTATLVQARHVIHAGTSATVKVQKNGVDATGFTGISVTTTATTTSGSVALADNDLLALVVTAVAGSPTNLTFTVYIDYTV